MDLGRAALERQEFGWIAVGWKGIDWFYAEIAFC